METSDRVAWARRLGVTVVVMTFALMVLGSWVKATGSGLACPDWPKCWGQWFPPFPSAENGGIDPEAYDAADSWPHANIMYEWGHRALASLLGIPFLAWFWITVRGTGLHPLLRWGPTLGGIILLVQIRLGGVTVEQGNAAPYTTAHLATATLFMTVVVATTVAAFLRPVADPAAHAPPKLVFAGEESDA